MTHAAERGLSAVGDAFVGEFPLGGAGAGELGGAAVVDDDVDEEHQDEDAAESYDDGGAGRSVELNAQVAAERGDQRAHGPADG